MSLDVGAAIRDGVDRTFARNGVVLMVVFLAVQLSTSVATDTINRVNVVILAESEVELPQVYTGLLPSPDELPFALDVGLAGALTLVLAVAVIAEAARIVGVRVLVSDHTETIPGEYVRRNIGFATVNGFVGGIVVSVLIGFGLILLVPGLFVAVAFFFVRQVIAVEDVNFVEAMEESWRLTAGDRLEVFALASIVVVVGFLASLLGGVVSPTLVVTRIVDSVIGSVTAVFGVAVAARAYVQLRDAEGEEDLTHWEELES